MQLKSLSLKNFKCFSEETNFEFGRITVLTGANSSGKSSVIYGILGAIQSGEFPFQFSANGKYVDMGDFKEIANHHNISKDISIGFSTLGIGAAEIQSEWGINIKTKQPSLKLLKIVGKYYELTIAKQGLKNYILNFDYQNPTIDPAYDEFKDELNLRRRLARVLEYPMGSIITRRGKTNPKLPELNVLIQEMRQRFSAKDLKVKSLESLLYQDLDNVNIKLRRVLNSAKSLSRQLDNNINYLSSFRQPPSRNYYEQSKIDLKVQKEGANYEHQIIGWESNRSKKYKELNQILNSLNLFQKIKSKRKGSGLFEIRVKTSENGMDVSITDVGFGISQFLPIIVGDIQLDNESTLFVSQPETHLHPSIQANFGDFLTSRISSTNKNYVVETHSEYLLNRLRLNIVKGTLNPEDIRIYYLSNDGNQTKVHKVNFLQTGEIKGAPKEFFDTYLIDVMDIALEATK